MDKSYKLLLTISLVFSIMSLTLEAATPQKGTNEYFLKNTCPSYEGFAGYCSVITPDIVDAGIAMLSRLNITIDPSTFRNSSETPYTGNQAQIAHSPHTTFQSQNASFSEVSSHVLSTLKPAEENNTFDSLTLLMSSENK